MKKSKFPIIIFGIFLVLLSTTIYTSFSSNIEEQEVIVNSITPVYDSNSSVIVNNNNVTFNDKNQIVKYSITIENTQDYDVKISDITLSTPIEEFLSYKVEGIQKNEVLKAKSTKGIIVSFETTGIKGWGRNFVDELIANVTFEKVVKPEEVPPPLEEDNKEEEKQPETPSKDESEKTDPNETESDTKEDSDEDTLVEEDHTNQNDNSSSENESLPEVDNEKEDNIEPEEDKEENPYTNDNIIVIVFVTLTSLTGIVIIMANKNKVAKYMVFIVLLGSILSTANAEQPIELSINFAINFKSQNVMSAAYIINNNGTKNFVDFWEYSTRIKNIYIQNEKEAIESVRYSFDITAEKNQRVKAHLVSNGDNSNYYDLYIQADGIIYLNEDASYYFYNMTYLNKIDNIEGLDTSNVKNMSHMFDNAGYNSSTFTLDLSNFNTSNVTDMNYMFNKTGYSNPNFTLDTSNFDTSKVSSMNYMFYQTGYKSNKLNTSITISNPNITSYVDMFDGAATTRDAEIIVHYTPETKNIVNKMIATKSAESCVYTPKPIDMDNLYIGKEITIKVEKFNIIAITDDEITLLAKYNLGSNYRQIINSNGLPFSSYNGWEYTPGPKDIDVQTWGGNSKRYINNYAEYLSNKLNSNSVKVDIITLKELADLGCTVPADYTYVSSYSGRTCDSSPYKSWLISSQSWWTRSATPDNDARIWKMSQNGVLTYVSGLINSEPGFRPTITISKEDFKKLNS